MDIDLYFTEYGSGTPFILLHGNGENSGYFKNQTEYFSKKFRVIAVDTRGHGKSPRGKAPFTLVQFADDLKIFLDNLNIKKAVILGFSDGGNIALIFALRYPSYVEKLILNGANLYPSGVKLWAQLPVYIGYGILSLISLFDKKATVKKEMLGLMANQPHINPRELSNIAAPSLVIVGAHDMIKEKHSKLIAESIPGCGFTVIPGDHFIASKNSAEFNRKTEDFLKL